MQYSPDSNTVATTDLGAYGRNLKKISSFIGPSVRLMAVVKANAYGHGMVNCARTALDAGASMLGVCFVSEGVTLRQAGIRAPILVIGPEHPENLGAAVEHSLTIACPSFEMLDALKNVVDYRSSSCRIHVKVDTGMGRIGVTTDKAPELIENARNTPGINVEGIFTHFPSADEDRDPFSKGQIRVFKILLTTLEQRGIRPEIAHMCNSAGTLKFPEAHLDLVRPGIMTYGLIPYPGSEETLVLEPVLSWKSRITFIKDVPDGFPVSYGSTFVTKHPSRLATVPVGYSHGYKRFLSNRGKAIVNGTTVPVTGRICMDQTVFDITEAGDVSVGDPIILIGSQDTVRITVEDHADIGGTISHEIVTGITGRVSRSFIKTT